jgi:hypothetical protein
MPDGAETNATKMPSGLFVKAKAWRGLLNLFQIVKQVVDIAEFGKWI